MQREITRSRPDPRRTTQARKLAKARRQERRVKHALITKCEEVYKNLLTVS